MSKQFYIWSTVALFTAAALYIFLAPAPQKEKTIRVEPPTFNLALEPTTPLDQCEFWQPWIKAFAPEPPATIFRRLEKLTKLDPLLSEPFSKWSETSANTVCVRITLDQETPKIKVTGQKQNCTEQPAQFGEVTAVVSSALTQNDTYINTINFSLGTGSLTKARLRDLLIDQSELLSQGYGGWLSAFPSAGALDTSGLFLAVGRPQGNTQTPFETIFRIALGPQDFWQDFSTLASYALTLNRLIDVETRIFAGESLLAKSRTKSEDVSLTTNFKLDSKHLYDLNTGKSSISHDSFRIDPMTVEHDVLVTFRGLKVAISKLHFIGRTSLLDGDTLYRGRYGGVGPVKISGKLDSLLFGGFTDTIKEQVEYRVAKENNLFLNGNHGRGWEVELDLKKGSRGQYLAGRMSLEASVSIINLIKYRSGAKNGMVLPSQFARNEFKSLAERFYGLLADDAAQSGCTLTQ